MTKVRAISSSKCLSGLTFAGLRLRSVMGELEFVNESASALLNTIRSFDTVKTRLQCAAPGAYKGPWDCFLKTVRNEVRVTVEDGSTLR